MIRGVGIDLMDMGRIPSDMSPDDAFVRRILTPSERAEQRTHGNSHEYLCSRFSMKEAVFKALGQDGDDFSMTDIEILADGIGRPVARLLGKAAQRAQAAGIRDVLVSISYDDNLVTPVAVADGTA